MSRFVVTFISDATRLDSEQAIDYKTCDAREARAKFRELCKTNGPRGSGIFLFDLTRSQTPAFSHRF